MRWIRVTKLSAKKVYNVNLLWIEGENNWDKKYKGFYELMRLLSKITKLYGEKMFSPIQVPVLNLKICEPVSLTLIHTCVKHIVK